MADIQIPLTTFWDILANAFDDPYFWIISIVGTIGLALVLRTFMKAKRRSVR
jgi:hypothetical protein